MAGLSIKSLRVFDRIVLLGTLSDAAKSLNMSQSAASRQLIELEHAIGLNLFHRTNRQLVPTDDGLRFHVETQHILAGLDEVPAIVQDIKRKRAETLSVVCAPRLQLGVLAPSISRFSRDHPQVDISASVLRRFDLNRWAATRQFDIGLGMLPIVHRSLESDALFEVRAAALMPRSNPLSSLKEISAEQLVAEPLIGFLPGLMARHQVDDLFRAAGLDITYQRQVSSSLLACQMAFEGGGIAVIDVATVWRTFADDSMALIPLRPARWWSIGMFHLKAGQPSSYADRFRSSVQDLMREVAADRKWAGLIRAARSRPT